MKNKKALRNIVLGLVAVSALGALSTPKIGKAIDVGQYYSYYKMQSLLGDSFNIDKRIKSKILRECGIRNKDGEIVSYPLNIAYRPEKEVASMQFFYDIEGEDAYNCRKCVEEQARRLDSAVDLLVR